MKATTALWRRATAEFPSLTLWTKSSSCKSSSRAMSRAQIRAGFVLDVKSFVRDELRQTAQVRRYAHSTLEAQPTRNCVFAALALLGPAYGDREVRIRLLLML